MSYNYLKIFQSVNKRLSENNFLSFDLCDITAKPLFIGVNNIFFHKSYGKYFIYPLSLLVSYFPYVLRKLFNIKKGVYPQAQALLVRAYLQRINDKDNFYRQDAINIIEYIIQNKSKGFKYYCWGQPYKWYSGKIIPAYTPRTTVTSQMIHTFADAYEVLKEEKYLDYLSNTCLFFEKEMIRSYDKDNKLCFGYTYIDKKEIYNANIMAASALVRGGTISNNKIWKDLGIRCLNYTINGQNNDGSWYYGKLQNNKPSKIDNYHTGYVIEELVVIKKILGKEFQYDNELLLGMNFYKKNLFVNSVIPKLTPKKVFPIDIQSCAQSIKTFTAFSEIDPSYIENAKLILNYTLDNFYNKNGSFYYRKYKNRLDKNSYIRWGDAWMLLAIAKLINKR